MQTLWGPSGQISDYATKHWADLLSTYYLPRWNLFISSISTSRLSAWLKSRSADHLAVSAVNAGIPFDSQKYGKDLLKFEEDWDQLNTTYPTTPIGDTVKIAKSVVSK